MTMPTDAERRGQELGRWFSEWTREHPGADPDEDAEYVARAREIMGLPPMDATP
jgi:hypothetical protein